MTLHGEFEWDERKARRNLAKHAVSFDDAAWVLSDGEGDFYHIEEYDDDHSVNEDRYVTTASHPDDRRIILRITWTDRTADDKPVTRIIGARTASAHERENYAEEIAGR